MQDKEKSSKAASPPRLPASQLPSIVDPIDIDALKKALAGSLFGANLLHYDSLESTNTLAKEIAHMGGPDGTVLLADEQTGGRGRMGRTWLSSKDGGLLFSILLRPSVEPRQVFALTMILAVSAAEVLARQTGLAPGIKWPNDLYLNGRKLAGILTELSLKEERVAYVVLGMGLNVQAHPSADQELRGPATSLSRETGKNLPRGDLLAGILKEFEGGYRRFLQGEREPFCRRWNELSMVLGRSVIVELDPEVIRGKALRIDTDGALIVREEGGTERRVVCGDVSLRME